MEFKPPAYDAQAKVPLQPPQVFDMQQTPPQGVLIVHQVQFGSQPMVNFSFYRNFNTFSSHTVSEM